MIRKLRTLLRQEADSDVQSQGLLDQLPEPCHIVVDGRLDYVNPALVRLMGASSADELIDREVATFVESDRGVKADPLMREEPVDRRQQKLIRVDGEQIWVEVATVPITWRGREASLGVCRDITSRIRARQALEESEERWSKLAENHPEPHVVHKEGKILYANPAAARAVGMEDPEQLLGRSMLEFVTPQGADQIRDRMRRVSHGEEVSIREYQIIGADGEVRYVESFGVPIRYAGEDALQAVFRDITEQKKYEAELVRAKEEAEQMNRLKTAFLANMSHEIRTPLTSIIGFTELLEEQVAEDQAELANHVKRSSERLLELLNAVLDLSKIEAGAFDPEPEPTEVTGEIQALVDLLRPKASEKALDVTLDFPEDAVWAELDRTCLRRVVSNLVENAIKFTEEGSITVTVHPDSDEFSVTVEDTGIGIEEEFQSKLFQAFQQASSGLTRTHEGAGLGLAITKELTDLMGGHIEFESEPGEGTRFTVHFPYHIDESTDGEVPTMVQEEEGEGAPNTIPVKVPGRALIIETDPRTAILLNHQLQHVMDMDLVETEEAGLDYANNHSYDVVLIDINSLGNSQERGTELLRKLRAVDGYGDIPVLALTAYAMPGDKARFEALGFDGYVDKPFRREDLVDGIRQVLQK